MKRNEARKKKGIRRTSLHARMAGQVPPKRLSASHQREQRPRAFVRNRKSSQTFREPDNSSPQVKIVRKSWCRSSPTTSFEESSSVDIPGVDDGRSCTRTDMPLLLLSQCADRTFHPDMRSVVEQCQAGFARRLLTGGFLLEHDRYPRP